MRSLFIALVFLSCPAIALAQSSPIPTLTVHGEGRVQVPPDHARLTVETMNKASTLDAATAAHRERANRALAALRALAKDGLTIERSTFRLDQVRRPLPPNARDTGETEYQAVSTYELKLTRLDTVDVVVTAIAATGLFELRNLRFGIDERSDGLARARTEAVADARRRAETYAKAAGVELGEILEISDTEARPFAPAAEMAVLRNIPVVPPESLALTASVTMRWRIQAQP
jgi:uncharacterized protein YggE